MLIVYVKPSTHTSDIMFVLWVWSCDVPETFYGSLDIPVLVLTEDSILSACDPHRPAAVINE